MKFYDTNDLMTDEIKLILDNTTYEVPEKNYVPAYHFRICLSDGTKIGLCNFRVGHNENTYYGGNIGYSVDEKFRGHGYAAKACRILFKLAEKHNMGYVIITCNPDNKASERTCENAGCKLIELADIPEHSELYLKGERKVCIYKFEL